MVRLAGFEPATFGSGDRRSSPAELQAHNPDFIRFSLRFQPIRTLVPIKKCIQAGFALSVLRDAGK